MGTCIRRSAFGAKGYQWPRPASLDHVRRALLLVVVVTALVGAEGAAAHAIVVSATPTDGVVVAAAPRGAVITFDSGVRVGPRNAAIRNDGTSVIGGPARITDGRTLVIPFRTNLGQGNFTVRWSVVSQDGHEEEGLIAFGVGRSATTPFATLTTSPTVTWERVVMRWLFLAGTLLAAGLAIFAVVVLRPLQREHQLARPLANGAFLGLALAFVGADALAHAKGVGGTRFELWVSCATIVAGAGAAAAALAPRLPALRYGAYGAGVALLAAPTLSGHALDSSQAAVLSPVADVLHLGAAALWIGGLGGLAMTLPRVDPSSRAAIVRRFGAIAGPALIVLVAAGASRALTELASVSQLWSTPYGRTLIAKSALLTSALIVGTFARRRLASGGRPRRLIGVELGLLAIVVLAAGILTDLQPGRAGARHATPSNAPSLLDIPVPPPANAYVDAQELGPYAVALAFDGSRAQVTVAGSDGTAPADITVLLDGKPATACGRGCYSTVIHGTRLQVTINGTPLTFTLPGELISGSDLLRATTLAYQALRTVTVRESLASLANNAQITVFREQAPDRFGYEITAAADRSIVGTSGVVLGKERWDRIAHGAWTHTTQSSPVVPFADWTAAARNIYEADDGTITFYDPSFPAWFRLRIDPTTHLPSELHRVAAAHYMTHSDSAFNEPSSLSAPS